MSPKYRIIDAHADWKTEQEQMGSKQKFWFRPPNDQMAENDSSSFPPKIRVNTERKRNHARYLCEVGVDKYTEKARGAIFIAERVAPASSPLELVRWCVKQADYRQFFEKVSTKLDLLDSETVEEIISKVPATWMTSTARDFVIALVCYNRDQLREIFR